MSRSPSVPSNSFDANHGVTPSGSLDPSTKGLKAWQLDNELLFNKARSYHDNKVKHEAKFGATITVVYTGIQEKFDSKTNPSLSESIERAFKAHQTGTSLLDIVKGGFKAKYTICVTTVTTGNISEKEYEDTTASEASKDVDSEAVDSEASSQKVFPPLSTEEISAIVQNFYMPKKGGKNVTQQFKQSFKPIVSYNSATSKNRSISKKDAILAIKILVDAFTSFNNKYPDTPFSNAYNSRFGSIALDSTEEQFIAHQESGRLDDFLALGRFILCSNFSCSNNALVELMDLIFQFEYTTTLHGTCLNKNGVVKTSLAILSFSNGKHFVAAKDDDIINTRIAMLLAFSRGVDIPKEITLLTSITGGKKSQILDSFNLQAIVLYFSTQKVCTEEGSKYLESCKMILPDKGFKSFNDLKNLLSPVSFFSTNTFQVSDQDLLELKTICMQYAMEMEFARLELVDYVPTVEFMAPGATSVFRLSAPFGVTTVDGYTFITAVSTAPVSFEASNLDLRYSTFESVKYAQLKDAAEYNATLLENIDLITTVVSINRQQDALIRNYGKKNFALIQEFVTGGDNKPILDEIIRQHSNCFEEYRSSPNSDADIAISKLEQVKDAKGKGKGKGNGSKSSEQQSSIVAFDSKPTLTRQSSSSTEAPQQTGAEESKVDSDDGEILSPTAPTMTRHASMGGDYFKKDEHSGDEV